MSLTRLYKFFNKNCLKTPVWAVVLLTVAAMGCAVSEKTPSATDNFSGITDDDFALLEEGGEEPKIEVADPLEPLNRIMHGFNDILYFWALEPCAKTYKQVVPKPARIGVRNFFHNLAAPARFANCLLQGKGGAAGLELKRFVINTTVGILGFGDHANDKLGIKPPPKEDLGQTLATYGIGNGFYIVLPLFGPSTLRDSAGFFGDQFMNPIRYVEPSEASIAISATNITNENSFRPGEYEAFKSAAVEPYIAMRSAFIQYRKKEIQE